MNGAERVTLAILAILPLIINATRVVDTDVLILGAGISGIAAANTLHRNGIDKFVIIEGSDRIGGRMKNRNFQGTTIELGANWIQGVKNNPIELLAKKYGLQGTMEVGSYILRNETGGNATRDDKLFTFQEARKRALKMRAKRRKNKPCEDMSFRVGLRAAGWLPVTPEEIVTEYQQMDFEFAVPPKYISMRTHMHTNESISSSTGRQYFITDKRGFAYIVERIAGEFLTKGDSRLKLNTRVKSISYTDHGVTVHTENGVRYTAKIALVTFSIGVLKSGKVKFSPELPNWKLEAIFKMNMVIYTKIFLKFPYKFWDDDEYIYYASKRRGYYSAWQNMEADSRLPKGTNILLITVTGEESTRLEYQTFNQTKTEIMAVLRKVYGKQVPEPFDIFYPRWGKDEFFYGSWANVPIGMSSKDFVKLQRNVKSLYFAGEATHELYNGYVHGGYLSGINRATKIVQALKRSKKRKLAYRKSTNRKYNNRILRWKSSGLLGNRWPGKDKLQ